MCVYIDIYTPTMMNHRHFFWGGLRLHLGSTADHSSGSIIRSWNVQYMDKISH